MSSFDKVFSQIDGIVFDMDGTLVQSMDIWEVVYRQVFQELGVVVDEAEFQAWYQDIMGDYLMLAAGKTVKRFGIAAQPQRILDLWTEFYLRSDAKIVPIGGLVCFLELCKQRGIKMGIATASPHAAIEDLFVKLPEIKEFFSACVSCDDVRAAKPDPAVYKFCAQKLQVNKFLVFEDSWAGIQGARACQSSGAVLIGNEAYKREEKLRLCDFAFSDYNEIVRVLQK